MTKLSRTPSAHRKSLTLHEALEALHAVVLGSAIYPDYIGTQLDRDIRDTLARARRRRERSGIKPRHDQLPLLKERWVTVDLQQ